MTTLFDPGTAIDIEVLPTFPARVIGDGGINVTAANGVYTIGINPQVLTMPWVNVLSYGAVGDGVTDETDRIQAAINSNPGKTIFFPYTGHKYKLAKLDGFGNPVNIVQPVLDPYGGSVLRPCNFVTDVGVDFEGPGRMPGLPTNPFQKAEGWYLTQWPSGGVVGIGWQTLGVEMMPRINAKGNPVGLYVGAANPPGDTTGLNVIAANFLSTINPHTGSGATGVAESDLNKYDTADGVGTNFHFTGNGSANPGEAILFSYYGAHAGGGQSRWERLFTGYMFNQVGVFDGLRNVDGTLRTTPALSGFNLVGIKQDALRFQPSDDAAGSFIYVTDSTGSVVRGSWGKDGNITAGVVAAVSSAAPPAGGQIGLGIRLGSTPNFGLFFGSGAPTLVAAKGSVYLRTDGSGTNSRMYVNTDGNTSWTAFTTAA